MYGNKLRLTKIALSFYTVFQIDYWCSALVETVLPNILVEVSKAILEKVKEGKKLSVEEIMLLYLDMMYRRIDEMDKRLTSRIDELDRRLTSRIDELNDRLSKRIDEVNKRIDSIHLELSKKIDETNRRIDEVNKRIDETNKRIDRLYELLVKRLEE